MDSKKIKIIAAAVIGIAALILLVVNIAPRGTERSDAVPLTAEDRTEMGNARNAPGYDPTIEPGYVPEPLAPE